VTNDCGRCGTSTTSDFAVFSTISGLDGYLCDSCRNSLKEWYDREEKPPVRGGCSSCGGRVEVSYRYKGGGAVNTVIHCPQCGWTAKQEGAN